MKIIIIAFIFAATSAMAQKPTVAIVNDTQASVIRVQTGLFAPPSSDFGATLTGAVMHACGEKVDVVASDKTSPTYVVRASGSGAVHSIVVSKDGVVVMQYTAGVFGNPAKKFCSIL